MKKLVSVLVLCFMVIITGACTKTNVTETPNDNKEILPEQQTVTEGNTNANIQNGGMLTYDDEHIYFLYQDNSWVDEYDNYNYDIIQMGRDGSNAKVLTTTIIQGLLNMNNGVLFGPAYGDYGSYLHAINIENGNDKTVIDKEWTYDMRIVGNRIYYTDRTSIISTSLDGKERKVIFEGPPPRETDGEPATSMGNIAIDKDEIYYVIKQYGENTGYSTTLNKINTDSGHTEKLFTGDSIENIQPVGDDLYYLDNDPDSDSGWFLYCNGEKVMEDKQIVGYSVADNAIVYCISESNNSKGYNVYRCDLNYTNSKLIVKQDGGYQRSFNIVGNDMFMQDGNVIKMINLDTLETKEVITFPEDSGYIVEE